MQNLPQRVAELLAVFHTFGPKDLDKIDALYAPNLRFVDPIQEIRGREAFHRMNERLLERSSYVRFDNLEVVGEEPYFMVSWHMEMRLKIGLEIRTDGVSAFRTEGGLIVDQRDYWDLLGAFVGSIPGVGPVYRRLVALLG